MDQRNVTITEATDVDTPTPTGLPSSSNENNTHGSTAPSRTDTSAPTASEYTKKRIKTAEKEITTKATLILLLP